MTEREKAIIGRLDSLGVDSAMWGVVGHTARLTRELHGSDLRIAVPAHIFVHRDGLDRAMLDPDIPPDATLINRDGSVTDLYFIGEE